MNEFEIPKGLRSWDKKLKKILKKPFPPMNEPIRNQTPQWDKLSSWSLICEELLDAEPPPGLLKEYYDELIRRGYSNEIIQEMRHFAWLTVGWLNFEKMFWEWCHLDEWDMRIAIEWQYKDGLIDLQTKELMLKYLDNKS
jgi:hypothetical protein